MQRCEGQVVAWGECGLDYSDYQREPDVGEDFAGEIERQKQILRENIEVAIAMDLPIQFHSRDCEADFVRCLLKWLPRKHSFHWHSAIASPRVVDLILREFPNAYFGVSGYIAFPYAEDWELLNQMTEDIDSGGSSRVSEMNAASWHTTQGRAKKVNLVDMVKRLPIDRIVLETDSPHFTVNTGGPADVLEIASSVAAVKDLTPEEVLKANERNAHRLYGIQAKKVPYFRRETPRTAGGTAYRGIRTWRMRQSYKNAGQREILAQDASTCLLLEPSHTSVAHALPKKELGSSASKTLVDFDGKGTRSSGCDGGEVSSVDTQVLTEAENSVTSRPALLDDHLRTRGDTPVAQSSTTRDEPFLAPSFSGVSEFKFHNKVPKKPRKKISATVAGSGTEQKSTLHQQAGGLPNSSSSSSLTVEDHD
ncbi:unnamed protein product [Amoebophrya sp. A120]|nr:unnamed protein product [Amoebophrya sp. A120]|eukprot:GSA120T00024409001.1